MILWADGFDHYGGTESLLLNGVWAEQNMSLSEPPEPARTGTRSAHLQGNNGYLRRVFGGAKTVFGSGAAYYLDSLPSNPQGCSVFVGLDAGNKPNVTITIETTGTIAAWQGDDLTYCANLLGETAVPVVTASAWNHIEARCEIDAVDGAVEVRVNGVTVLNLTGVNTVNPEYNVASCSQIGYGWLFNNTGPNLYLDDVFVWDTTGAHNVDFIGDKKVFTDFPNADTADAEWTRSTGSTNFGVIDENPPNDNTDYLTTDIPGEVFGVTFPALASQVVNVAAVILIHRSRKTDAGTANLQAHLQSNGDVADGVDRPMTTAFTYYQDVFEVDPDTAAPFTRAAASAIALQMERSA